MKMRNGKCGMRNGDCRLRIVDCGLERKKTFANSLIRNPKSEIRNFPLVFFLLFIVCNVSAAGSTGSRFNYTESKETAKTSPEERKTLAIATQLGLSQEEWRRYETIMQGEGQFRWSSVDPVWVLGISARSGEERKHYAELAARNEEKVTEQTLAFQKAFMEARTRLYGGGRASSSDFLSPSEFQSGDRLLYFLELGCTTCAEETRELISWVQKYRMGLDIYFLKTEGNDALLQTWAVHHRVPGDAVRTKRITLNHDRGEWARLSLGESLLVRRDNRILKVLKDKP